MEQTGRKATLKSIAEAAGVHPSTVSRALMGTPGSRIPEETIQRIRKAALELDYEPDPWAQSLRTRRGMMIGMAMPRLTDIILGQMFEAAQSRARDFGYQTMTVSAETATTEGSSVKSLLDRRVDGLILATATVHDEFLSEVAASGVPFVLLNRASDDHPAVRGDDVLGGYLATKHLIDRGHTRIGHVSGPSNVSTGKLRIQGYRTALQEAGIAQDDDLILSGDFDATSTLVAAGKLLDLPDPPTAIFAVNDIGAVAAMAAARERALRVPEDVAVVGYNDSEISSMLPIPLTTVRVQLPDMGRLAVELLMRRMAGDPVESVVMHPELVERESSAVVR